MFGLLILFELISVAIFSIMMVMGGFDVVIKDFRNRNRYDELTTGLSIMAIACGWFLAPYFMWLVYRYFEIIHKK